MALDTCACDLGWTGASCALPDCSAVDQCSGKGECVSSNQCRCYPGFAGANCSEVADCGIFANCSGHGTCLSMTLGNVSCRYGTRVMLLLFIYLFIHLCIYCCCFVGLFSCCCCCCLFGFFFSKIVTIHLGNNRFGIKNCIDIWWKNTREIVVLTFNCWIWLKNGSTPKVIKYDNEQSFTLWSQRLIGYV